MSFTRGRRLMHVSHATEGFRQTGQWVTGFGPHTGLIVAPAETT